MNRIENQKFMIKTEAYLDSSYTGKLFKKNTIIFPKNGGAVFTNKKRILTKQLLRCGTSIGANIHEATHGESKLDFIHKLSIALKEANETSYWLRLLYKTQYLTQTQFKSINTDCKEFLKLLTSIIKTAKKNLDN